MNQLLLFLLLALALVSNSKATTTTGIEKVSAVEKLGNFFRRSPISEVVETISLPHEVSIVSKHPDELRIRNRFSKALEEKKITESQFEIVNIYNKSHLGVRWVQYRNLIAENVAKGVPPTEFRQLLFQHFVENQPLDSPETFLYFNKAYEMVYNRRTTHPESSTIQKVEMSPALSNDPDIEKAYLTAFQNDRISEGEYHLAVKTYKEHLVDTLKKDLVFIHQFQHHKLTDEDFIGLLLEHRLSTQLLDSPDFFLHVGKVLKKKGRLFLSVELDKQLKTIVADLQKLNGQTVVS